MTSNEAERIRAEYARRERSLPADFYSLCRPANLFAYQQKSREILQLLNSKGLTPLNGKRILDVGCGDGDQLLQLETWGARAADLAGIDLIESRLTRAIARFSGRTGERGPELRMGDASQLPWPDETFDLVHQSVVFTSITDTGMKSAVAREILRVLKPGGVLVWYDFFFNNPKNLHVRGIGAREIRSLFPGCSIQLKRIALAPPVARRLVPITWIGSLILERLLIFNTHYLGLIRKDPLSSAPRQRIGQDK